MTYVLDTNTLSFALAGDPAVCRRMLSESRTDIRLPQPAAAEIEYGLARLPASRKRDRLIERFHVFLAEIPRMAWTDAVSRAFGAAKADLERRGVRIEDFDVAIAAHALALEGTLVSDDSVHMSRIAGLRVESWRSSPGASRGLREPGAG